MKLAVKSDRLAPFARLLGDSPAIHEVKALLGKVARSPASTVLLRGESGTGKGLIAEELHRHSARARRSFQNITCSALPESLLESELFGHESGAFTDARQRKKGLLEIAQGGTVFLDEIGEMSPALQVKLLRFLEERAFKRVGGTSDIRVDVRVVAATNADLERAVEAGAFRPDLYYRLTVLSLRVPPLRDRPGDLPILVRHFVDLFNAEFGSAKAGVLPAALELLERHSWPGNVRELRNTIEHAVLLADAEWLGPLDFEFLAERRPLGRHFELPPEGVNFGELELDCLTQALARTHGNQSHAARLLGMTRHQLRYRMDKFGLDAVKPRSTPSPGRRERSAGPPRTSSAPPPPSN